MSLRAREVAAVAVELNGALRAGRVRVIRGDADWPLRLWLRIHRGDADHWLLTELDREVARVHLAARPGPAPEQPTAFVMLLRKHLEGAFVAGIRSEPGERVLTLELNAHGKMLELVIALRGVSGDMALLGSDGTALGSMRGRGITDDGRATTGFEATEVRADLPLDAPSAWIAAAYGARDREVLRARAAAGALRTIRAAERRLRARLERIAADEAQVADAEAWKRQGELLQSARGRVPRGATEVRVRDWYAEGAPEVVIALDPTRTLEETIERCFHRYRRFVRGAAVIARRRHETEQALDDVGALRAGIEASEDADAIGALVATPGARRLLAATPQRGPGARAEPAARLPYRELVSSDGFRVLVGRGGADNDRLTFHVARGNDIWMHAMDWAGAHVVIALGGRPAAPRRTLEEAALLAAWNSRGRSDGVVAVQWTQRKHVRKPRGVAAGRVSVAGGSTIEVRMDDPRLPALLSSADGS